VWTFGPVNSRRFGISLGIDLSPKQKSCNFDCVYCELEASKPVATIQDPPTPSEVVKEVKEQLKLHDNIEVITITSNGEPTLYKELEELVDELNKIKEDKKLLILSNASTICNKKVQDALKKIDIVKLSLDCATKSCFKKIDRPLKELEFETILSCMKDLSLKTLIIEILVVQGINDKEKEFEKLNKLLQNIKPARVDIGTIDRPPAYKVEKVSEDRLYELSKLIKNIPVSLIRKHPPKTKQNFTKKEKLLNLLKHRPQSQFDVDSFFSDDSKKLLEKLCHDGFVKIEDIGGVVFYEKVL